MSDIINDSLIDMDARLADMPIMAQRPDMIDAKIFNLWRRYRLLPDAQQRFCLKGLKSMRFILADHFWAVVDSANYDAPVLAWVDFDMTNRSALHEPVGCKINYYHFAASAVRARALGMMATMMEGQLKAD
ncbi:MAG TPA: hypothetical protein ENJ55_07705 [Rhizobiales bacterium]|nr:hypothetical protein [Hyphomicrobiales bacterium]